MKKGAGANDYGRDLPDWLSELERESFEITRQFVLASCSLKEMARIYDVSYPTIRLDRLIQKVKRDYSKEESYVDVIKNLTLDGEIFYEAAEKLIATYPEERG